MTFQDALKKLAELYPEKFAIWNRQSLGGIDEFVILSDRIDEYKERMASDTFFIDSINDEKLEEIIIAVVNKLSEGK